CATLPSWTYLWISHVGYRDAWRNDQELRSTLNAFESKLREVGIDVSPFVSGQHIRVTAGNVESEIDTAIHKFVSHASKPVPRLILVILPSLDAAIYSRVKFACDVKEGLRNVCV